jgi:hypothetical protein
MSIYQPLHFDEQLIFPDMVFIYLFIYLFINLFATSVALGQFKQVLKHKSNAPSQKNLQDLHKFS